MEYKPPSNVILLPGGRIDLPAPEPIVEESDQNIPPLELMVPAVEAVLFALGEPVSLIRLRDALGNPELGALRGALEALRMAYDQRGGGVRLVQVAGGYQLRTIPQVATWVARARNVKPLRLSKAAVETLSIVAYRQPVVRHEVDKIRGVDSGGILRSLIERGLVRVAGRSDNPGRPLLYGTTRDFLELFGLRDLSDLPTLSDLRQLRADDPREGPVPVLERPDRASNAPELPFG
jgi:segregation and condensation protein B